MGDLLVAFCSTDCLKLGIDEYGTTDETFTFELTVQTMAQIGPVYPTPDKLVKRFYGD